MAQLELYFLGSPRLERNGQLVETDTRKAVALLAYLALTGQPHTREALAALLWPEYDDSHAKAALRRTLSTLKSSIGDAPLLISRDQISLHPDQIWCDVLQFQQLLTPAPLLPCPPASQLETAVSLYHNDFLTGFSLRDSLPFDDWQRQQAEHWQRELSRALEQLVHHYRQRQQYDRALNHAHRWLTLDPLHEAAHQQLMQLYAQNGQRTAALNQYRHCLHILETELGVAPLPETTALYHAIQENQLTPPATPHSLLEQQPHPTSAAPQRPHSLIGRTTAWETAQTAVSHAQTHLHTLAIIGEAGIGKTWLAEAVLTQAEANGIITLHSRCYPSESSLAYTPLVATLRAIQQHPTLIQRLNQVSSNCLHETSRLLPDLTTPHAPLPTPHTPLTSPAAQTRFFEGITQLLQTTLAGTIWLLDDLHWADSATLDLLAYLRHHATTTPLLLLLTWRNEETAVSPHLHQIMTEAERSQTGQRLTLGRWSQQDVTAFVQSNAPNLAGTVDHRLFAESEGLPFFAAAYLDALAQQQDWTIPPTARDLLLSRLEAMPPMPQQLLQTAAAIGRSFPFDTLQQASGRSEEETITGLERLLAADLVRETAVSPPQFDFTHDKLRTLVYDETSFMRRRLLHSRIAHTIYSQQRTPAALAAAASQLAHHHQLAGNETEAANQFKLAGDHARSLFANREALTYYETALALGYGETAVLHEALGDLHTLLGRYEAAIGAYETAVSHLTPNENLAIAQLEHKLGLVHQRRGSWETAESHFLAAQTIASTPRLLADRSRNAHHRHQPDEALALAQQALTLAQQTNDSPTLAQVHNLLGTLARQQNDFAAAEAQFTHSLALAETLDDPTARIAALNNLGLVYGENGRFAAGITALQTALALCQTQGDRHRQAALHNNLADLHHAAGQHETAMHHLKQAATLYADISKLGTDWQPEIWKLTEW